MCRSDDEFPADHNQRNYMQIGQYPQLNPAPVMTNAPPQPALGIRRLILLGVVVILTGVGAGLGGMFLALLLHVIQHLAYGYSLDKIISPETFLMGVSSAPGYRRILVLGFCGLLAAVGWWVLYRFGRPLVSIKQATTGDIPLMPPVATLSHVLLQIGTVALGSPL